MTKEPKIVPISRKAVVSIIRRVMEMDEDCEAGESLRALGQMMLEEVASLPPTLLPQEDKVVALMDTVTRVIATEHLMTPEDFHLRLYEIAESVAALHKPDDGEPT